MSQDLKLPALKSLQGYLWQTGYDTGALRCPLFVDVAPSMRTWRAFGIRVIIYSSGSVAAQKLLFQHTNANPEPDLRGLIEAYFDTVTAGPKTQTDSYRQIVQSVGDVQEGDCLFLSDNIAEVEAAREAGLRARLVVREGNVPVNEEAKERLGAVTSFEELQITR
jgi:enolase-phosphatase E1